VLQSGLVIKFNYLINFTPYLPGLQKTLTLSLIIDLAGF